MDGQANITGESATPRLQQAWQEFHAAQAEVLRWMEETPRFKEHPQHRAKAYHTMMEALAMVYNFAVAPRMTHPRLFKNTSWQTDMYTLGQNGPDLYYAMCFLDGRQSYRLTGRYGDLLLILCQVISHLSGHPDSKMIGDHDLSNFDIKPDGTYEIILSAEKQAGNWIPLDPALPYHFLLFRRFMGDWHDDPGEMRLERISDIPDDFYDADEFDEAAIATRIERGTEFLRYLIRDFNINLFNFYTAHSGYNNMRFLPGTITSEVGSSFSSYAMAVFDLQEDEALIIEMDQIPDGAYWSFQAGDVWSRSLNFTHRHTTVNMRHAAMDEDGGFRAVVSHQDPGFANWIDTTGRIQGTVVFRNYRATRKPVPKTTLVKFADVAAHMPANAKKVTPAERQAALARRAEGYWKLHGE